MIVENAELADIDRLTKLRIAYLKEDHGGLDESVIRKLKEELPDYFKRNLNENIFCYLIRDGEETAACAFLLVVEKPASPAFITGKTGTVLNVYTGPSYRRRGYAKTIMKKLLSDAEKMNVSVVELKSTEDGYALYKSVGFSDEASKYHSMKWYNHKWGIIEEALKAEEEI